MSEEGIGGGDGPQPRQDQPGSTNGQKTRKATSGKDCAIKSAGNGKKLWTKKDGSNPPPKSPGRPLGKRDFFAELIRDLERVEGAEKKSFLRHRWQRAFKNDGVAADMMSYLLPKPKPVEHVEPPDLSFHGPSQVNVINHAEITFKGNGNA